MEAATDCDGQANGNYSYDDFLAFVSICFTTADYATPLVQKPVNAFNTNISYDDDRSLSDYDTDMSQTCYLSDSDIFLANIANIIEE